MMKKSVLLMVLTVLIYGLAHAQFGNLTASFSVINADCYNNGKVVYGLKLPNGSVVNNIPTNLMMIRAYYKMNETDSAHYSNYYSGGYDTLHLDCGEYIVGVEAVVSDGNGGFTKIDNHTTLNITTSYIKPTLYKIANIAIDENSIGSIASLSCMNTGSVQFAIKDGKFPYTIKVIDSNTEEVYRTVVFNERQNSGEDANIRDYKDYYTFDSLAPGNYSFLFEDGCGYGYPKVGHEVDSVNLLERTEVWISNKAIDIADSNIIGFQIREARDAYKIQYEPYLTYLLDNSKYKISYEGLGESDWRNFENNVYIWDTVKAVHKYCDLYDKKITFEYKFDGCEQFSKSADFKIYSILKSAIKKDSTNMVDSIVYSNDNCGIIKYKHHNSHTVFMNKYIYESYYYSTENMSYRDYWYYTRPFKWIYTDISSGNIIKIHSIGNDLKTISQLYDYEVENYLENQSDSCKKIFVRRELVDAKGCVLYNTEDTLNFCRSIGMCKPNWKIETYDKSSCCEEPRYVTIRECDLETVNQDTTIIQLVKSPEYNRYNFEIMYDPVSKKWILLNSAITNTATIDYDEKGRQLKISDNCLPSGPYNFVVINHCDTFYVNKNVEFNDAVEYQFIEKPTHKIEQQCSGAKLIMSSTVLETRYNHDATTGISNSPIINTINPFFRITNLPENVNELKKIQLKASIISNSNILNLNAPGRYIVTSYIGNNSICGYITYNDTIEYVLQTLDFDYEVALLCDSSSTMGDVFVGAINGTKPYTYTLYSNQDKTGEILGTNETGVFSNVPMTMNSKLSCMVTDACGAYFHINITPWSLAKLQLAWFDDGMKANTACEGSEISVHALEIGDVLQYEWSGPNGFHDTVSNPSIFVPRGNGSGWYKVSLKNLSCNEYISDSLHLTVIESPSVSFSRDTLICPGQKVAYTISAYSPMSADSVDVKFIIENDFEKKESFIKIADGKTISDTLIIYYDTKIYTTSINDGNCEYLLADDTLKIKTRGRITSGCDIVSSNDTICYGGNAQLIASSKLQPPYQIIWYSDSLLTNPVKEVLIENPNQTAVFDTAGITQRTVLYVSAKEEDACPYVPNLISGFVNLQNDTTIIECGSTILIFDSGGDNGNYHANENIRHHFKSENNKATKLVFDNIELADKSYLWIIVQKSDGSDSIVFNYQQDGFVADTLTFENGKFDIVFLSSNHTSSGFEATVFQEVKKSVSIIDVYDNTNKEYYDEVCKNGNGYYEDKFDLIPKYFSEQEISDAVKKSGEYTFKYTFGINNLTNCDSSIVLKLKVLEPEIIDTFAVIRSVDTLNFYGQGLTVSGIYKTNIYSTSGCDSIIRLNLKVIDCTIYRDTLCELKTDYYFAPFDSVFQIETKSGIYEHRGSKIVDNKIIDTIVYYYLTILQEDKIYDTINICTNERKLIYPYQKNEHIFFDIDNETITIFSDSQEIEVDNSKSEFGDFKIILKNRFGCDSVIVSHINVLFSKSDTLHYYAESSEISENQIVIDGKLFSGITSVGEYIFYDTLQAANSCDSIVTYIINIEQSCKIGIEIVSKQGEICGNDGKLSILAKDYFETVHFSLDGNEYQGSGEFDNLENGTHFVIAKDAKNCTATIVFEIEKVQNYDLSIVCSQKITDTLDFGDNYVYIADEKIGYPTVLHSLNWGTTVLNDKSDDNLFEEGKHRIVWTVVDKCGKSDTCYQEIEVVFPECPNAIDCEGNEYKGVRVGSHCWTQRNLESMRYSDCSEIPCIYNYHSWQHPDSLKNVEIFGRLYCYEAVIGDNDTNCNGHIQGICPEGWYLPSKEDYLELLEHPLSELRTPNYWLYGDNNNITGFSALPAGMYNGERQRYEGLLTNAYFWYISKYHSFTNIFAIDFRYYCDEGILDKKSENMGFSVRCIKEKKCRIQ